MMRCNHEATSETSDSRRSVTERRAGYTLVEVAITLAILGVTLMLGIPRLTRATANGELRDTALAIDAALETARGEAIRTGDVQLFFILEDANGDALTDGRGNPVPIAIVNDGAPGSPRQNCQIDPGEKMITFDGEKSKMAARLGEPPGLAKKPDGDTGPGNSAGRGSSFADPNGNDSMWVMFRPEGMPVAFDADCNMGALGSGAGTLYLSNEDRAYAVTVSAMGMVNVEKLNEATGDWE